MHLLKRLELNGFKSFAGKTVLEFPEGITAIVGPNGSGKSNVVDAIRWLLGEREAKNLRGGKGEDLIFAGTPKRPRAGMAQASLHFENKKKFFPVDFAEITVAREIARNGAGSYFLNKSEILLRDLVDLFTKVRLGSRGLVIVTQGNSDVFVRATSKERREMIEEILGLKEYELRRTEAERRLTSSEINIEKVRALIEEIVPHLRSLKRQTLRWEKRSEFEAELTSLEDQFFGSQFGNIHAELQSLAESMHSHEKSRGSLKNAVESAEKEILRVEGSEPKEREELRGIKKLIAGAIEKRSGLQQELGRLEGKIESASRAARTSIPAAKMMESIGKIRDILKSVPDDAHAMRGAIKKALLEIEAISEAKEDSMPDDLKIKTDLAVTINNVKALEGELTSLHEKETALEGSQENFHHIFRKAIAAREAAKQVWETWERTQRELTFKKERLEFQSGEIEKQMRQAGRRPEEFRDAQHKKMSEHELGEVERRIFKLRGDLASIGEIDQAVVTEARTTEERHAHLALELHDLEKAQKDLRALIRDLEERISVEFKGAMGNINAEFQKFFAMMFGGGHAKLVLEKKTPTQRGRSVGGAEEDVQGARVGGDEKKPVKEVENEETNDRQQTTNHKEKKIEKEEEEDAEREEEGIVISVSLPRKKISSLEMLSGGERSLVGIAALFALVSVSPPPFLVLDEIDAALDERNARRFAEILKEFSKKTQFIIITHNRATMEVADVLYGVTLGDDGTSQILSLKFEAAEPLAEKDKE